MALLVVAAVATWIPGDADPFYDWVRHHPDYTLFLLGAFAATAWVDAKGRSDERARRYAAEQGADDA